MNHERLELKPVAALSDDERAALKALSSAVYPRKSLRRALVGT